jgi:tRNA 5-methylaminomethyl-2-thiouridine biosynthesis bifunctional protein
VQLVSAEQLTALSGVSLASEAGLFFPRLGWLRPANVCQQLAQGIARVTAEVNSLVYDEQRRQWQLMDSANSVIIESPAIVLANGYGAGQFTQTGHLPLRQIRGQITSLPQTQSSSALRTVICGAGYVAPASNGIHTLGATYGLDDDRTDVRADDHRENLHSLGLTDPALAALFGDPDTDRLDGRAAVRCTTRDYLPIAGPAPRFDAFTATYAELRRNARTEIPHPGSYWPGLWHNCGHGSRGLTNAPLAAELVASQLNGVPWPLPRDLANALSPARFIIRNRKRNII